MDWYDDIQVEELQSFDFIEDEEVLNEIINDDSFNVNDYLNSNIDYWLTMTDTVNVLPHMKELREAWRRQDFKFTPAQATEYDILLQARRERVKYFYDNDLVCKISKSAMDKLKEEDWYRRDSQETGCPFAFSSWLNTWKGLI